MDAGALGCRKGLPPKGFGGKDSWKGNRQTYGFALSPYLVVDGWAIPLYMRGFLTKTGEGYRSLLFLGFQSQKDALDQASYEILRSMK